MAREFLMLVKESSLGTIMTSATAGTDSIVIRLDEGNGFGMDTELVVVNISHGGGLAIDAESISDHYMLKGQIRTKLYPSQAPFLLNWLAAPVNAGQTLPWITTEPPGDLASVSIFHAKQYSNGTFVRKRYAGAKCTGGTIAVSRQATVATLTLDVQACRSYGNQMDASTDPTALEFPAPAETDYPTGPYTFKNTSGKLKIGTTRTLYEMVTVTFQNAVDGRWFENSYLQINQFCGRKTTLATDLYFKASPDNRAAYEALTAQDTELTFDNGVNTAKIDLNTRNKITKLSYELPNDKAFMEHLELVALYDPTIPGDINLAFT